MHEFLCQNTVARAGIIGNGLLHGFIPAIYVIEIYHFSARIRPCGKIRDMNRDFMGQWHRLALATVGFSVNLGAFPTEQNSGKFPWIFDTNTAVTECPGVAAKRFLVGVSCM